MSRTQQVPVGAATLAQVPAGAAALEQLPPDAAAAGRTGAPRVTIRRAAGPDLPALAEFFAGLSVRTRYQRFFAPVTPTGAMLRRLSGTGTPGGTDALLAFSDGAIIGHAMAVDQPGPGDTCQADIGVVVADAWQGRGVGSALMTALLAGATSRGVTALSMDVLPGNARVLAMIARRWPTARTHHGADGITVGVRLGQPPAARPRRPRSTCHAWGATARTSSRAVAASA